MKSLSEIETTSKRASRAVGFSWGIAEEVGKCIRLLELFGLPGIKNLNQYYQNKKKENFENLKSINQNNKSNKTKTAIENVGHPILLDALSNMSFASLMLSTIIPMVQIGGLMVFAMLACSFGTLTLLASTIEIGKNKEELLKKVEYIDDRFGHDKRYSLDISKIYNDLNWKPNVNFNEMLKETIKFYIKIKNEK